MNTLITKNAISLINHPIVGKKAVASKLLKAGATLHVFEEPVVDKPTMHTLQLAETRHVSPFDGAECISHSCTNNNVAAIIEEKRAKFIILKDVKEGEELSFNYNCTEWDMNSPFVCQCAKCQGRKMVQGFKHLEDEEKVEMLENEVEPISTFIRNKAKTEFPYLFESISAAAK
eukprot:snap_masked-scaffold_11-processed-gene-9.30-mRNA-1 protein AED:0.04 eAED:0.04 QI:0/-1/0/1/-1/1/1/0/173